MRLLTLAYPSAAAFLAAYDEAIGTLLAMTKTEVARDELILVEVAFPRLPNRPLVRARCTEVVEGGLRLRFEDDDVSTCEFLLKFARGEVRFEDTTHREHKRVPSALAVEYRIDGKAAKSGHVDDLSAGGCFVRDDHPPDVGLAITVNLSMVDEPSPIELTGHVAWVRSGKGPGFGIEFDNPESAGGKRLRQVLRRAIGTGDVDL